MKKDTFSISEKKLITGISLILGMRMMGVSFIIPIFSIYATCINGTTEILAGVAVGTFGLMQTLLQIPMGTLSDRWGRKKTTIVGLSIYLIGTLICGMSQNIYHLIIGRLIAGAGAVTGVTMAWLTDGVDISRRNSALSYVGIAMGTSVILGFTLSPIVAGKGGISFLFYLCAAMIFISIIYILFNMQSSDLKHSKKTKLGKEVIGTILKNRDLIRLNLTGFIVNLSLSGVFFMMPLLIHRKMAITDMWIIYVPMAIIGTTCMFFITQKADTRGTVPISMIAFITILAGTSLPVIVNNHYSYIISFILFYSGYCILSPLLPAAVSRYPNMQIKGTIMSIFNSSQFIGSGIGGLLGGVMLKYNPEYLFIILTVLIIIGLASIRGFRDFEVD